MTYFPDLSPYAYSTSKNLFGLRLFNVGWLSDQHPFPTGLTANADLDAVWRHCWVQVDPMMGFHACPFCLDSQQHVLGHIEERSGVPGFSSSLSLGNAEICVFADEKTAFKAPNLIYHYMTRHNYRPPDAFIRALRNGPDPADPAYVQRLERLGFLVGSRPQHCW